MKRYSYKQLKKEEQEEVRIQVCEEVRAKKITRKQALVKFNITLASLKSWLSKYDTGGIEALKDRKAGRPSGSGAKLSPKQFEKLKNIIESKTPEQYKLSFCLWSREAVQELIKKLFKTDYSVSHISDIMRQLGFTIQKPRLKYAQQNDVLVQKWLKEEYPEIEKRAKKESAEIHWSDETAVQNKANCQRSYGVKGKTPVVVKSGKRIKCSLISSVTNQGKIRFMSYQGGLTANTMIEFAKRLIKSSERKIFLIVDNLPVHKSQKVKNWEEANKEDIEIIYLPAYSPELNPTELVNSYLKKIVFKEKYPKDQEELEKQAHKAMRKIQNKQEKVKSLFQHPSVSYAKAS